jgi:hypothetical protein
MRPRPSPFLSTPNPVIENQTPRTRRNDQARLEPGLAEAS